MLFRSVPGGGAATYKLRPVFTYNNGYWEVYSRFQGIFFGFGGGVEGSGLCGRISSEKYVMGKQNSMKRAQDFLKLL